MTSGRGRVGRGEMNGQSRSRRDTARGCRLLLLLLLPTVDETAAIDSPLHLFQTPPTPVLKLVEAVRDALTHSPGKRHSSCRAEQVYASVPCQGKSPEGCLT